jgi:LysM repeat protein
MTDATAASDSDRPDSVEPLRPPAARRRPDGTGTVTTVRGLCPYLLAEDGSWRAPTPSRAHTCAAIGVPAPLALDKQRRLCLTPSHRSCAAYLVAAGRERDELEEEPAVAVEPITRPYPRTAPVALDHGRVSSSLPTLRADRGTAQFALVGLMVVAFAVMAFARLSGPGEDLVRAGGSASPILGAVGTASPVPASTTEPAASPVPGGGAASANPTAAPATPAPSPAPETPVAATPRPSPAPTASQVVATRTHTVASGETLSAIAAHYGTTVKVLRRLNNIDDPRRIRIGQVLQIP